MVFVAFLVTTVLLAAATLWRLGRRIDVGLLLPLSWLVFIPLPILIRGGAVGLPGAPRDHLMLSVALANLALLGMQALLGSTRFSSFSHRVATHPWLTAALPPAGDTALVRYVFFGLFALAVGLAILHWSLMPRIPLLDVITSGGDPQALALERENSAKLLPAPALLKYAFTWNSRIFFPLLLCTAVLCRWRLLSILTAVIGLLYIASPLEKLPSLLFVLGPFLAVALRDGKRLLSPRLIAGAILSLVPVFLIAESPRISNSLHHIGGATVTTAPSAGPSVAAAAPSPGAEPGFGVAQAEGTIKDLILRRIGSGPADVTGAWFGYFPAAHGGFLNGTGWQPWRVLSPHYQSPANLVGLWAYYGRQGYDISSLSAYASFIADGWAEFGYVGVLLACLVIIGFGIVLELMRAFSRYRFCLACYAVGLLLLSAAAPEAGLMALIFSLGLVFCPAFCLGYLVAAKLATTPTRPIPALPTYRVPAR